MNPSPINSTPAQPENSTESSPRRSAWELILDYGISIVGLLLLLPLILAVIVFIKLVSPGPAIFKQRRIGLGGRGFMIYKLRTMRCSAATETHEHHTLDLIRSNRPMTKMDASGDSRLIPLGRFLRTSGIDELPQLVNVLKSQMSIVGPRPCVPSECAAYSASDRQRFDTLPGITGLWQVSGKNALTFKQMIERDLQYTRKKHIGLYLNIILKTPSVLLKQTWAALQLNVVEKSPLHDQPAHLGEKVAN